MRALADAQTADRPRVQDGAAVWLGWRTNGELLRLAESQFDLFVTSDQNIRYQQNLAGRQIAILELSTSDLRRIQAAAQLMSSVVASLQPREYRRLEIP